MDHLQAEEIDLERTCLLTDPAASLGWLEILCATENRAAPLQGLLARVDLPVWTDYFQNHEFCNLYLPPTHGCSLWIMAHHDVLNEAAQNANDNTASVVNAILLKLQHPEIGVVLTDGEEPPHFGLGSRRFSTIFGSAQPRVINLELTGLGGWAAVGMEGGVTTPLARHLHQRGVSRHGVPFNDATILRQRGLDAVCLFTCTCSNQARASYLDGAQLSRMHSKRDTITSISVADMFDFRAGLSREITYLLHESHAAPSVGEE